MLVEDLGQDFVRNEEDWSHGVSRGLQLHKILVENANPFVEYSSVIEPGSETKKRGNQRESDESKGKSYSKDSGSCRLLLELFVNAIRCRMSRVFDNVYNSESGVDMVVTGRWLSGKGGYGRDA